MAEDHQSSIQLEQSFETFKELPSEVLEIIFLQLSTTQLLLIQLVCRRWRDVVRSNKTLMDRILVKFPAGTILDHDYVPECLNPEAMRVSFMMANIVAIPAWWTLFGEKLVQLDISCSVTKFSTLIEMLQRAPNLKKLKLDSVDMPFNPFPNPVDGFVVLNSALNCKLVKLEELFISSNYERNKRTMFNVFGYLCPNIKHLSIPLRYPDPIDENNAVQLVKITHKSLESLEIAHTRSFFHELAHLQGFRLKSLTINSSQEMTYDTLRFLREHPCLESLTTRQQLDHEFLNKIGVHLPNLKVLSTGLGQHVISSSFLGNMINLEQLSLNCDLKFINFYTFNSFSLTQFTLSFAILNNDSLAEFLIGCSNLQNVALYNCNSMNWTNIYNALGKLPHLHTLNLSFLNYLDGTTISSTNELHRLKNLTCELPKPMMAALFGKCTQLKWAKLTGNVVDDDVVLQLCQQAKKLESLWIWNANVTDVIADHVTAYGTVLRELKISHCSQITVAVKEKLRAKERVSVTIESLRVSFIPSYQIYQSGLYYS